MHKKSICVIPARGGSKRIKNKNIKDFYGKPIIAYTIDSFLKSSTVDHVWVSTDDQEIAEVAKFYGAEVPFSRSKHLADDQSDVFSAICEATRVMKDKKIEVECICLAYASAPLIRIDDLRKAKSKLIEENWDFVISATKYNHSIYRSFELDDSGNVKLIYPANLYRNSQTFSEVWHDAGQFCWGKFSCWSNEEIRNALNDVNKTTIYPIPSWRSVDIDTIEDWERAEIIYKVMNDPESKLFSKKLEEN